MSKLTDRDRSTLRERFLTTDRESRYSLLRQHIANKARGDYWHDTFLDMASIEDLVVALDFGDVPLLLEVEDAQAMWDIANSEGYDKLERLVVKHFLIVRSEQEWEKESYRVLDQLSPIGLALYLFHGYPSVAHRIKSSGRE